MYYQMNSLMSKKRSCPIKKRIEEENQDAISKKESVLTHKYIGRSFLLHEYENDAK